MTSNSNNCPAKNYLSKRPYCSLDNNKACEYPDKCSDCPLWEIEFKHFMSRPKEGELKREMEK